jgi:integrase
MARSAKMLGAAEVGRLTKVGRHACGGQLYLEISPEGYRRWLVRYTHDGKPTWQSLGKCDATHIGASLKIARETARMALDALAAGDNPRAVKAPKPGAMSRARVSVADAIAAFIDAHSPKWANDDGARRYVKTWTKPIAQKHVGHVTVPDIEACLRPYWRTIPVSAQRTRRRLEDVFAYAIRQGWARDNPATLDAVRDVLGREPKREVKPHPSLPWKEAPALLRKLQGLHNVGSLPLQFAILTASRTQEARDVRWSEIDLEAKLWTLPPLPGRTKQRREHEIPLSRAAVAILESLPRSKGQDLVFGWMARDALLKVLYRKCGLKGKASTHGFRSTFTDWCIDNKVTDSRVAEAQLAHKIKDKTRGAYERTSQLEERARVMECWSFYLIANG